MAKKGGEGMFGYVIADLQELSAEQKDRYRRVYCGICRRIRLQSSSLARLGLSNDMAFLALLLMSLYEPEESCGSRACGLHPIKPRPWTDNVYIAYAADMNVALAYYNALDNWNDDKSLPSGAVSQVLKKHWPRIREVYPRQCAAIEDCLQELSRLERENAPDPDAAAGCFGRLLGQLLVYHQDLWAEDLYQLGYFLGRFIYLADAAVDYEKDKRKGSYNPFVASGMEEASLEQYLVMAMSRCARFFEKLPLVQDKEILNNMIYSGVWLAYRSRQKKHTGGNQDG